MTQENIDAENKTEPDPFVFLSHRTEEKSLADQVRKNLLSWEIPSERIVQSSDAGSAFTIGANLDNAIRFALGHANLIILIYTHGRFDWSFCSYEVGLALQPDDEETRVVVLQCYEDVPSFVEHKIRVRADKEGIETLVNQFHKANGFFPGYTGAFKPHLGDEVIKGRAEKLFQDLQEPLNEHSRRTARRPIWSSVVFEIPAEVVDGVRNDSNCDLAVLQEEMVAVKASGAWGISHFGYRDQDSAIEKHPTLKDLVSNWKNALGSDINEERWVADLCSQCSQAIRNAWTTLSWEPFKSAAPNAGLVYPIVTSSATRTDGSMQLETFIFLVDDKEEGLPR